jgi:hypothetical protein
VTPVRASMHLDPLLSLALNIHASSGVYALLLGSGVSRAAKIPTGWEVVLDLIRRVAKLAGEDCEPDPATWFTTKYAVEPDYSKLLDTLAPTAHQRQQILRQYFEPTEEERNDGLKQPTKGHRAIARLVAAGYIRVILTTNFDRLTERAIENEGVTPVVLSAPDALAGALPLAHQRCVVAKLHGDYLDTRILNTPGELAKYHSQVNKWLDRVLDEFGLIVVGWSGEWDRALRAAMERCKTRRFGFYWASVGEPRQTAKDLVTARGGVFLRITDADGFFEDLANKVTVLDDVYSDHPANTAAAVALVKRYLGEPPQPIRLHDFLLRETDRVFGEISKYNDEFIKTQPRDHAKAVSFYLAATATLRTVFAVAAYWGGDSVVPVLSKCLTRMAQDPAHRGGGGGVVINSAFRLVPVMAVLYAAGLGFVAAAGFVSAANLLTRAKAHEAGERVKTILDQFSEAFGDIHGVVKSVPSHEKNLVPFSEMMFQVLGPELSDLFSDHADYETRFDEFELLVSMIYGDMEYKDVSNPEDPWLTPGRYVWKYRRFGLRSPLFLAPDEGDELARVKQQEPFAKLIAAGHFGRDWNRLVSLRRAAKVRAAFWR